MNKSALASDGTCKLTGTKGRFVASHLIPLALTRLSRTGNKHIETGIGLGSKSRSNSWYDRQLVSREGEDTLAAIDTRGIEALRQHKLVWSGWNDDEDLAAAFSDLGQETHIREVQFAQSDDLQLFFLSLLWRAAASTRQEFADVSLPAATLEDLRLRVLHRSPGAFGDYPVQLFQLTTRGVKHNRAPFLERKRMPLPAGTGWGNEVDYARFYFDGLTSHIHLPHGASLEQEYLRSCLGLGPDKGTIVFGHRFEESRAWENIKEMTDTVAREERTLPSTISALASATREYLDTSLQTRRPKDH